MGESQSMILIRSFSIESSELNRVVFASTLTLSFALLRVTDMYDARADHINLFSHIVHRAADGCGRRGSSASGS
jgi:hypothetical protein